MGARPAALVAVAFLVASGGCVGLFGGDSDVQTLTPAAVPTNTPPPAPGVTDEGSVNPEGLVSAHEAVLENTSYRFQRVVAVTGRNGTLRVETDRRIDDDGTALEQLQVRGEGPIGAAVQNWTRYRSGDTIVSRTRLANGQTVTNRLLAGGTDSFSVGRDLYGRVLTATDFQAVAQTSDTAVLNARERFNLSEPIEQVRTGSARSATAQLVVTGDGLIRELTLRYETEIDGQRVRVRVNQRITQVGNTSVERPDWVDAG